MKVIFAQWVLSRKNILKNQYIVFNEQILDCVDKVDFKKKYPYLKPSQKCHLLTPGFINPHVHLEFCNENNQLLWGDFVPWLQSIFTNFKIKATANEISTNLKRIIKNGTTTLGAISNFGNDIEVIKKSGMRAVIFNEIMGSTNLKQFEKNFQKSFSSTTTAAVALQSLYSTHPEQIDFAIDFAQKNQALLSMHLLESRAEKKWIKNGTGSFRTFFKKFFNEMQSRNDLQVLQKMPLKTIFVHANYATLKELKILKNIDACIISCPISNCILGSKKLSTQVLEKLNIPFCFATDGHGSNPSIDILEDLKVQLLQKISLNATAKRLFIKNTAQAGEILRLKTGQICPGFKADFLTFCHESLRQDSLKPDIYTRLILGSLLPRKVVIAGNLVVENPAPLQRY